MTSKRKVIIITKQTLKKGDEPYATGLKLHKRMPSLMK